MDQNQTNPSSSNSLIKPLLIALIVIVLNLGIFGAIFLLIAKVDDQTGILSPLSKEKQERPLDAFSFDTLTHRTYTPSALNLESELNKEEKFTSHLFSFTTDGSKVTGQINLPPGYQTKKSPVVVMLRGYVDPATYQTGIGTKNAAAVFARNGYITIAPDFLGYGGSDNPENSIFFERLEKPVTVLNLIASVKQLDYIDTNNIFIWGHSNGGQIALSVLEISGEPFATTLWAPVSKGFPYNILYYTDEYDDYGKQLRQELANFEKTYNTDLFSIHKYWDRINAPLQIHQGGADDAVPLKWTNELVDILSDIEESTQSGEFLDVTYYKYPSADHNLRPDWDTVVARDLEFFIKHLK